jgi:hypothetical protein
VSLARQEQSTINYHSAAVSEFAWDESLVPYCWRNLETKVFELWTYKVCIVQQRVYYY